MRTKPLITVVAALGGLVLGAGIGAAAAQSPASVAQTPSAPEVSVPPPEMHQGEMHREDMHRGMDEMHEAMRSHLPAELADECDEMHASMGAMHAEHRGMGGVMHGGDDAAHHETHHRQPTD